MKIGYFLKYHERPCEAMTRLPDRVYAEPNPRKNFTWECEVREAAEHEWRYYGGYEWMHNNKCVITLVVDFDGNGNFEEVGDWEITVRCRPIFSEKKIK